VKTGYFLDVLNRLTFPESVDNMFPFENKEAYARDLRPERATSTSSASPVLSPVAGNVGGTGGGTGGGGLGSALRVAAAAVVAGAPAGGVPGLASTLSIHVMADYRRMGLPSVKWRISQANAQYELCPTYPNRVRARVCFFHCNVTHTYTVVVSCVCVCAIVVGGDVFVF